ncbi:methylenetetrahydrofolate reductase [Desulfomonile tiedjei]|uniref:Methylenetetrahydrofolate reductase n=1 Tax=Desulfomonile tiedjei (strain ATCC 49306 / DSM 6799 / DCB-1) TaxID=706587 RepID=I4CD85_DESTA|nr:methylenetetrahydrofolate reductase [Desulfomonile tiedjei]AFM27526.1 5,10-methylenetetrahydrofolate reductase [Desulfomonile tiedjei DSM 6799]
MKITELFAGGTYVITSEVGPVKGCMRDLGDGKVPRCLEEADILKNHVHAINVTDNQSAVMRLGSLAASVRLKERGVEPIYQITCRDRNRIALQSELLNACSLGIDNVLVITGDHTTLGDHRSAKPVFDLDSVQLLRIATQMKNGYDMAGNQLTQATDFALGAVVNPNFEPLDLQLIKMEKKIAAGAQFFQTQTVYDAALFEKFIRKTEGFGVPIQIGIVLIKSAKMAEFMNRNIAGITVPDRWVKRLGDVPTEKAKDLCVEMTSEFFKEVAPMTQGVHFMPLGWSDVVPRIIDASLVGKAS